MKTILTALTGLLVTTPVFAQHDPAAGTQMAFPPTTESEVVAGIAFPVVLMGFLVYMLISLLKYLLDYRIKSQLINRGMADPMSTGFGAQNIQEKRQQSIKLAILFCGLGLGLILTYLTAPIHIHSLAIMSFSLGLSYLAYFFYLKN